MHFPTRRIPSTARTILGATCFTCFVVAAPAQESQSLAQMTVAGLFMKAYEALGRTPGEAIPFFEEVLVREPANVLARRQLGSIYVNLDRPADALRHFLIAQSLLPSDTTQLQIAYLYNRIGENGKALAKFGPLRASSDPQIAEAALRAVDILLPLYCAERDDWWSRVSGTAHYEERFEDVIVWAWWYAGRYVADSRTISLYGVAALSADSKSKGGALPVIYLDNYALAGAGIRWQPIRALTIDVQPGVTFDLIERPGKKRVSGDFRVIASVGAGFFPDVDVTTPVRAPFTPFADGFLSAGYYSRYSNGIGYSQGRVGVRALTYSHSALDVYLRGDFTGDTRGDYFNNLVALSPGIRFVPHHSWGLNLLVEYQRGTYWIDPPPATKVSRWFSSWRVLLVFDRFLCL